MPTIDIWDPTLVKHVGALPLEGVDERPVDVVQPELADVRAEAANANHKVEAVGQRPDMFDQGWIPDVNGGHTDAVYELAVTPDGQHVISASSDTLVKVWSVASKSLVSTCRGHTDSVYAVAVTPDGQRILSGSTDHTVGVWLLDGTLHDGFKLHTDWVTALVALPDNQHALSGSADNTATLFDVNNGNVLRTFMHHTGPFEASVVSLALLPDGLRFVSGSYDVTARIVEHGLAPIKG